MVENYLFTDHKTDVLRIMTDPDENKQYSMNINFIELFENDTNMGNNILKNPEITLNELDDVLLTVQQRIFEESDDTSNLIIKPIHARVYGLPASPELHRTIFPKNEDIGLFLQITGTVTRVTAPKMLEYERIYMCTKCKETKVVQANYDQNYAIIPPKRCKNVGAGCNSTNLVCTSELSGKNCKDYQEIKIQEQTFKMGIGKMPNFMWVTLEDDLVDVCKPGDDVTICATVKRRWGPLFPGKLIEVDLVLKANHIQINNIQALPSIITPEIKEKFAVFWKTFKSNPLEGRDLILKSFCPKLYGMYIVKLAVALVLAGGSRCDADELGNELRAEPHLLLVGDPGTGKSQLLRYAAKLIPRSVLTTGIGSTTAGLTVAAVMEDGQWQLEGGALVLADGGICCIDEFNTMKAHDRTSIHEAMEQQTISVAKASIICKLKTRCSILAATNPKGGHLDSSQPLTLNLAISSPLLSRFDLVLMLKDNYNEEWDNLVADYILSGKGMDAIKLDTSLWNFEMVQQYFMIIKTLHPGLTITSNKILSSYYQAQRQAILRNKARTTVRLLDSLIRLSQAHARFMFHDYVHVMDALYAIVLIECSMHGECTVILVDKINVQASFSTTPMESYVKLATTILTALGLQEILHQEISLLENGYEVDPPLNQSVQNDSLFNTESSNQTDFEKSHQKEYRENSKKHKQFSFSQYKFSKNKKPRLEHTAENTTDIPDDAIINKFSHTAESEASEKPEDSKRTAINPGFLKRTKINPGSLQRTETYKNNSFVESASQSFKRTQDEPECFMKTKNDLETFKIVQRSSNTYQEALIAAPSTSKKALNNPETSKTTTNQFSPSKRFSFKTSKKDNNLKASTVIDGSPKIVKKTKTKKATATGCTETNKDQTVSMKKTVTKTKLNPLEIMNMIPSVNDDFDLNILNFEEDDVSNLERSSELTSSNPDVNVMHGKSSLFLDQITKSVEEESASDNPEPKDTLQVKSPDNNRIKKLCSKFRFIPRDLPPPAPPE